MANKGTTSLIQGIIDVIKANGAKSITGSLLQTQLINIIQSRGLIEVMVSTKTYLQNEFVSYNDTIYKTLATVNPDETPVTNPEKFQVQGTSGGAPSNAVDITFTPGASGLSSTNVDAAIKEVNSKADQALLDSESAVTAAGNAETTADAAATAAGNAQTTADGAASNASDAQDAADAAQAAADSAQGTADGAATAASNAQDAADAAQLTADNAAIAAGNAQTSATTAVNTANNAQSSATAAVGTANTAQATATSALSAVDAKMDKVVDAVDGNLAGLNASGQAIDTGINPASLRPVVPIDKTWADEETGILEVGDISTDEVIEIRGFLRTGVVRAKVIITITHDGTDCEVDYQMTPYRSEFETIFTTAVINSNVIELNYDVGLQGGNVIFKALIENFNIG